VSNNLTGDTQMIKVNDGDKEYSLGVGDCLMVQDLQDHDDMVQVDAKEFSQFEVRVFKFLSDEEGW
jgi:hypothetical protein